MRIQMSLFKLQGGGAGVRDYRTGERQTAKFTCARCRLQSLGKITNPAVPRRGPVPGHESEQGWTLENAGRQLVGTGRALLADKLKKHVFSRLDTQQVCHCKNP